MPFTGLSVSNWPNLVVQNLGIFDLQGYPLGYKPTFNNREKGIKVT